METERGDLPLSYRNIDKAGGLDNYVRKIAGTKEDSQGAVDIRTRLGDSKTLREQQLAQKQEDRSRLRKRQQKREASDQQHRFVQVEKGKELRKARAEQSSESPQAEADQRSDASTLGWLRDRIGSNFKWK